MLTESILHDVQHLFRSYEAPVYSRYFVPIDDKKIPIRRKLEMFYTKRQIEEKARELLETILERMEERVRTGILGLVRSKGMEAPEAIRLALMMSEDQKEQIESIVTSKLLYTGTFEYYN